VAFVLTALASTDGLISLRPFAPGDEAYVLDTWMHGLEVDRGRFLVAKALESTLSRSKAVVACLTDQSEAIVGFAIAEPGRDVVRFCAVRARWANYGILEALIDAARAA
jgi:hypothetical protein